MTSGYLVLPRLQVQTANALSAYWLVNGPPVTAAMAFGHALARHLDATDEFKGCALIHHHSELQADGSRYNPSFSQRRGASFIDKKDYSKNSLSLSLQPTVSRHLTISLVLEFDEPENLDLDIVEKFLHGGRFSGGQIIHHAGPEIYDQQRMIDERFSSAFWVMDRTNYVSAATGDPAEIILDYLSPRSRHVCQALSAWCEKELHSDLTTEDRKIVKHFKAILLDIFPERKSGKGDSSNENTAHTQPFLELAKEQQVKLDEKHQARKSLTRIVQGFTWLSATTVGYKAFNHPKAMKGSRDGKPHAFAEPLVALTQYVSDGQRPELDTVFWREKWLDETTYVLKQAH